MPKSVLPITLNNTDVILLKSILSGETAAGAAVQKRAKAILLLSEGKQIKDTAREIGMRENSVTEIRRRFLAKGTASLMDRERPGRPATKMATADVEAKVCDIISGAYSSGTPIPSVKDIAKELNATEKSVRTALKKHGLIQERRHVWEFPVCEGPEAKTIDLCGMFLSPRRQLVFVRVLRPGTAAGSGGSAVVTKNSDVAAALSRNATADGFLDLAHALETFTSGSETRSQGKQDALSFVKELYDGFCDGPADECHLFICGDSLAESSRTLLPGITIHAETDIQAWTATVESIFSMLCREKPGFSQKLSSGISAYMQRSCADKAVFQWKKNNSGSGSHGDSAGPADPCAEGTEKPAGTIEFEARIMADDGHWITYTAKGLSSVRQEQFDLTDANAYLNSFDAVEQAIAAVSHDAARGINEAYTKDLVKKTNAAKTNRS